MRWLALVVLFAAPARADVRFEGERSMFTAGDRPTHAFWNVSNDGDRPVRVELVRLTQGGRELAIDGVRVDDRESGRSFEVPPRASVRVMIWLDSGPGPFDFELEARIGRRTLRAVAHVSRGIRHPVHPKIAA